MICDKSSSRGFLDFPHFCFRQVGVPQPQRLRILQLPLKAATRMEPMGNLIAVTRMGVACGRRHLPGELVPDWE
jgi:hypothetical protein